MAWARLEEAVVEVARPFQAVAEAAEEAHPCQGVAVEAEVVQRQAAEEAEEAEEARLKGAEVEAEAAAELAPMGVAEVVAAVVVEVEVEAVAQKCCWEEQVSWNQAKVVEAVVYKVPL